MAISIIKRASIKLAKYVSEYSQIFVSACCRFFIKSPITFVVIVQIFRCCKLDRMQVLVINGLSKPQQMALDCHCTVSQAFAQNTLSFYLHSQSDACWWLLVKKESHPFFSTLFGAHKHLILHALNRANTKGKFEAFLFDGYTRFVYCCSGHFSMTKSIQNAATKKIILRLLQGYGRFVIVNVAHLNWTRMINLRNVIPIYCCFVHIH